MALLLILYNRPDLTELLFDVLRIIKPPKIYLSFDGPRTDIEGDLEKCNAVKKIFEKIDWKCDKIENHHITNVGSNTNMLKSIDWFFKHEEKGIILEDDCLPHPSFFEYCYELLARYEDDPEIFMLSGFTFKSLPAMQYSYRFSRLVTIWGWATWRRAWTKRVLTLEKWPAVFKSGIMDDYGKEGERQAMLMQAQYSGETKLKWGSLWRLTCLLHKAKNIVPYRNLILNTGFNRQDATNTNFSHPISKNLVYEMNFPLLHPPIEIIKSLDESMLNFYYENINRP